VEHPKASVEVHGVVTPEYIAYCRRDVLATSELLAKLLAEHARHPVALVPTKAYSPASVGKAYLRQMGITPLLDRLPDFPPSVLGHAMTAYYGGRAECHIRRTLVPVVYLDFLSMYPTVNGLMGLWWFLTSASITVEDATEATRELLNEVTLDACFEPEFWRRLPVLVQIEPDGDIVPVRARYGNSDAWQIGVNPVRDSEPLVHAGRLRRVNPAHGQAAQGSASRPPCSVQGPASESRPGQAARAGDGRSRQGRSLSEGHRAQEDPAGRPVQGREGVAVEFPQDAG